MARVLGLNYPGGPLVDKLAHEGEDLYNLPLPLDDNSYDFSFSGLASHFGLKKVKNRIIEYLAVKQMTNSLNGPILCLVGPPGVGKTSLAFSIAKSLNRNFVIILIK